MDKTLFVFTVSASLCCILGITIAIITISHIQLFAIHNQVPFSMKCFTYLANILATITCWCFFALLCNWYINKDPLGSQTNYLLVAGAGLCSTFGLQLSSYIIYLLRLRDTFKDSMYRVSNFVLSIFMIEFIIYAAVSLTIYYQFSPLKKNKENIDTIVPMLDVVQLIIGSIIYISLLILFTNKLFKLMTIMKSDTMLYQSKNRCNKWDETELSTNIKSENDRMNEQEILKQIYQHHTSNSALLSKPPKDFLNDRQQNIMYLVTKTTILVMVSIATSFALNVLFIHVLWIYPNSIYPRIIVRDFQCIYCWIEVVCLYLNWKRNDKMYLKLCCGCNRVCYCVCTWMNWCCARSRGDDGNSTSDNLY